MGALILADCTDLAAATRWLDLPTHPGVPPCAPGTSSAGSPQPSPAELFIPIPLYPLTSERLCDASPHAESMAAEAQIPQERA